MSGPQYNPEQLSLDDFLRSEVGLTLPQTDDVFERAPRTAQDRRKYEAPSAETRAINTALVERLKALADGMQKSIDEKINHTYSGGFTHRKQRISDGIRQDGYHLEKVQAGLRALASAHENKTVPLSLSRVNSRAEVERLIGRADSDLLSLLDGNVPDRAAEIKRRELEAKVKGMIGQVPGFFPTPKDVVRRMISLAHLEPGQTVLEPSAGSGAIADEVLAAGASVDVIEYNYTLRELLESKGHNVIGDDFMEIDPAKQYDVVIQNPPFENGADIDHVYQAVKVIKPGGTLVSVMCEGVFYRKDKKSVMFRGWLDNIGYSIELPEGSFKESGTGVATRLVVINLP